VRYFDLVMRCSVLLVACQAIAFGQTQDRTLESELGLQPLPSVYLLESVPAPPAPIWNQQNPSWKRTIHAKKWSWQPDGPDVEQETKRGRRTRRAAPAPRTQPSLVSAIDSVIQFDTTLNQYRLDANLAKNFLDGETSIKFHALVETPNGGLFIGKVDTPIKLIARRTFAGGFFDEYVKKVAQLRIYRDHPDVMELRFVNAILRKEILPPGTPPNKQKPREFRQWLLACPTLIVKGRPSDTSVASTVSPEPEAAATPVGPVEAAGSSGTDELSGNGAREYDSQATESPYVPAGSHAVRFKERGHHVSFDKPIRLGDEYTIEAIVRTSRVAPAMMLLDAGGERLGLDAIASEIPPADYNQNRLKFVIPTAINEWHHVAAVYNNRTKTFFLNGEPTGVDRSPRASGTGPMFISHPEKFLFFGEIQAIRVASDARYTEPFAPPSRLTVDDRVVVLLSADDVRGTVWLDRSGNGYDGVLQGAEVVPVPSTEVLP